MTLVGILIIVLALLYFCFLIFFDRLEASREVDQDNDEYRYPAIDDINLNDARKRSLEILKNYGRTRTRSRDVIADLVLAPEAWSVLTRYSVLTFDSLTYDLDCDIMRLQEHDGRKYLHIGWYSGGEAAFVCLNKADETIYIETGAPHYNILAPTIHHYVLRAHQESEWASQ